MKARINSPIQKCALGVNIPKEKADIVSGVMAAFNGSFKLAGSDCGGEKIGFVCGLSGYTESGAKADVSEELLIFSGLDGKELNKAVTMLREKGCDIPLKAIVTPHNRDWTVSALASELAKEHEYMTSRGKSDSNG